MTEAMPFLQKYDITFLRPPTIRQGLSSFLPLSLISRAVKRLSVVKSYRKKQK